MSKNLKKIGIICFCISVALFIINYLFFHYVTDDGITIIKQEEAGKPFVANLIGNLSTLFLFSSIFVQIFNNAVYKKDK